MIYQLFAIGCLLILVSGPRAMAGDGENQKEKPSKQSVDELLKQAEQVARAGKSAEGLKLASRAIEIDSKNPGAYFFRATLHSQLKQRDKAIEDFGRVIEIDPKIAIVYDRRGDEYFKSGKFKESIADYDRYIELEPGREAQHWRRGIAYYYAREYVKGQKQFEGYQTFDSNDVENAVWRYLCMARESGVEKARATLLKIGDDRRVPMRQIYELFAGNLKTDEVLKTAVAGEPAAEKLHHQLFYAHLYLGLYFETEGNAELAKKHIDLAAEKYRIGHFMWDVARVHSELLKKKAPRKGEL